MSLATQLSGFITRLGTEFKDVRLSLSNKLTSPVSGGSPGYVLTKLNSVGGIGATFNWSILPPRNTPIFMTGTSLSYQFNNPNNYNTSDLFLDYQTGNLWFLNADSENGNAWLLLTTLALAANVNTKARDMAYSIALGG